MLEGGVTSLHRRLYELHHNLTPHASLMYYTADVHIVALCMRALHDHAGHLPERFPAVR